MKIEKPPIIPKVSSVTDLRNFSVKKEETDHTEMDDEIHTHELNVNHPFKDFKRIVPNSPISKEGLKIQLFNSQGKIRNPKKKK